MAVNNSLNLQAAGVVSFDGAGTFSGSVIDQYSTLLGGPSNTVVDLGVATNGQLVIGSTGATPVLANILSADSSVTITNTAGGIDLSVSGDLLSLGAFGSTPNADGLSLASNVLNMQPADGTHPGGVSTTTQTLAGAKTFANLLTYEAGMTGEGITQINVSATDYATSIGNTTGSSALTLKVGTGNFSLDGVGASTYGIGASTVAGTITIGGTSQSGTITLGASSATNIVDVGTGSGATTVNIATGATNAKVVHIADGAVANAVTVGSTSGAASLTLNSGSAGIVATGVYGVSVASPELVTISSAGALGSVAMPVAPLVWSTVTGATQTIVNGHGYFANAATGGVAFTLPTSAAEGTSFAIAGLSTGSGWSLIQNDPSQSVQIGSLSSTPGAGGSLASTNNTDGFYAVNAVADTLWVAPSGVQGNIDIV